MKNIIRSMQIKNSPAGFIVLFGSLVLIVTWALTLWVLYDDRRLEMLHAGGEAANISVILERHIHENLIRVESGLYSLRGRWESGNSTVQIQVLLNNLVESNPSLFNLISVIDAQGNVLVTDKKHFNPTNSSDRPFFTYHKENRSRDILIGRPELGRVTGKWYIPVSLRLQGPGGKFSGVLLASVNPEYFSLLFQEVSMGRDSLVYLADFSGVIYSGMLERKSLGLDREIPVDLMAAILNDKTRIAGLETGSIDNIERITSRTFVRGRPMFVSVGVSRDEYLKPSGKRVVFLAGVQILISLIIIAFVIRLRQVISSRDEISYELDRFFSTSLDLLCIADLDGRFRRVNREWEHILGYSIKDLEGRSFLDFVHPEDMQATLDVMKELGKEHPVLNFTNRFLCMDGSYRYIEWRSTPHGRLIYSAARDITDRKINEEALLDSEERFKALHNASFGGIAIHDRGVIIECNQSLADMCGYTMDELIGMNGLLLCAEKSRETVMNNIMSGYEKPYEVMGLRKNGEEFNLRIEARNIPFKGRTVRVTEFRDITEQKKGDAALRESEEKFKAIFNTANIGFSITDDKGNYVMYNNWWLDFLGYEADELKSKTNLDITHPDDIPHSRNNFIKLVNGEIDNYRIEKRFIRKDGKVVWGDLSVSPVKDENGKVQLMIGVVNDLTERRRAEEERAKLQVQLNQSQKMETVGRLAGGVAHDFNNMLGAIFGYTELSLRKLDSGHPVYPYLLDLKKAAERSANLTKQLLAFARRQTVAPRILDLNETVEGMLKMLRQIIGEDISLEWAPCSVPAIVRMDPAQIDQILVNLCVNARDAIDDTGRVIIETGHETCDEALCSMISGASPGEYVVLSVSDNGHGMDKETLKNLFEPFYTTKKLGKGTGLGLATVYGIVNQNGGFINVYSEPGLGTTLKIYLPQHKARTVLPDKSMPDILQARGDAVILIVEDEEMLLDINSELLLQLGYTVLAASSPVEAIRIAGDYDGVIDLLITDVIMPEMNGRELAKRILEVFPGIRILYMSGYTADVIAHHGVLEEGVHFIQKPFSFTDLTDKVEEALMEPL